MGDKVSLLGYGLLIFNLGLFWYLLKGKFIKIYEQTQNKLNFTMQPKLSRFLGLFIGQIGVIFLCATFTIIPVTQLNCDRVLQNLHSSSVSADIEQKASSVICQLIEFDFLGHQKSQKQISGLIGVYLDKQTKTDKNGKKSYAYQVLLLTNRESIPFTRVTYSDYFQEKAEYIILRIKRFLAEPLENNLIVKQDDRLAVDAAIILSLFCFLLSLLLIAAGSFINCNFDKESNVLTLSRYRWFGKLGKAVFQYSLNEIVDIKVESSDSDEGGFVYRVTLILASGESVPLSSVYSSGFEEKQQIVNLMKTFLAST